jgi:DNA replication and repair protein RecF
MDRLFSDSASARRRFLDRLVLGFDTAHARRVLRYEYAMRERARLLKFGPRDPGWLDGLENEMAESGVEIAAARATTIERLNASLLRRGEAGAFPSAQLALSGDTDRILTEGSADAVESLRIALSGARHRDAEARRTTVGPHVSDLSARHTAKRMDARDCSTGEQKALLISIVLADARELAHLRGGRAPVLLLDEIAAHLDPHRRAALFEEIVALGAQAWLTGTDLALFEDLTSHADIYLAEAGQFASQN